MPSIPLQFSAHLTITNHLVESGSDYPIKEQHREVMYDFLNLRAKVKSLDEEDGGKVWLRRYDQVCKRG